MKEVVRFLQDSWPIAGRARTSASWPTRAEYRRSGLGRLAVHAAEVWDPGTGQWTTLASNTVTRVYHSVTRVYHSVSVLLPDGHIVHAASGDAEVEGFPAPSQRNTELFHGPPMVGRVVVQ